MKRRNEQRRNRLAWLWTIIRMICIAVIAVSAVLMAQLLLESHSVKEVNRGLQELYRADADELPAPTPPPMEEALTAVYEVNPHTVGWLTAGEHISLPVVQYEDNEFYLERDFYGDKSRAGTLFLDRRCTLWPENSHWMIHGHNMKDGSMFAGLHQYEDSVFFEENPYFYIYTEDDKVLVYEIFAAYEYTDMDLVRMYQLGGEEMYAEYLSNIYSLDGMNNNFNTEIEVTIGDKVLTLTTCISTKPTNRYLVQGKLVAEGTR